MKSSKEFDFLKLIKKERRHALKYFNFKLYICSNTLYDFVSDKGKEILSELSLEDLTNEKEKYKIFCKMECDNYKSASKFLMSLCMVLFTSCMTTFSVIMTGNINYKVSIFISHYFFAISTIIFVIVQYFFNAFKNDKFIIFNSGINVINILIQEKQQSSNKIGTLEYQTINNAKRNKIKAKVKQ